MIYVQAGPPFSTVSQPLQTLLCKEEPSRRILRSVDEDCLVLANEQSRLPLQRDDILRFLVFRESTEVLDDHY